MEEPEHNTVFRRYLLGDLPETEQRHVEESFLLDSEYRENALILEDELIEDYLDNALSEQERHRFEAYFLATSRQQQKLRIARSLKKIAVGKSRIPASAEVDLPRVNRPRWSDRRFNLRNPLILLPMAAGLLIAIVFGALIINELRRSRERHLLEASHKTMVEQDLARINSLDKSQVGPVFPVVLPPVSIRGAGPQRKFDSPGNGILVELQLVIVGEQYPAYRALLQKMEASESFTIQDLHAASTPAGKAVLLRLPPNFLLRGRYRLQLFGVTATGENELVGDYDFQVTENI